MSLTCGKKSIKNCGKYERKGSERITKGSAHAMLINLCVVQRMSLHAPAKEKPSGKIKQDALQLQVECLPSTFVTLIKNSTNKQTKQAVFFPCYCPGP